MVSETNQSQDKYCTILLTCSIPQILHNSSMSKIVKLMEAEEQGWSGKEGRRK